MNSILSRLAAVFALALCCGASFATDRYAFRIPFIPVDAQGDFSVSTGSLGFDDLGVGLSATQVIEISNTSSKPLTLGLGFATGIDGSANNISFLADPACFSELAPLSVCRVYVEHRGDTLGSSSAQLIINCAGCKPAQRVIPVQGVVTVNPGGAGKLTLSTGSMDFGRHRFDEYAGSFFLVINSGSAGVGYAVSYDGDFDVWDTCDGFVEAGSSCEIHVSAGSEPSYPGRVYVNGVDGSHLEVDISGEVVAPANVELVDDAAHWLARGTGGDEPEWFTRRAELTYANIGTGVVNLASPPVEHPLVVVSNTCTSVAPGALCKIVIELQADDSLNGVNGAHYILPAGADEFTRKAYVGWEIAGHAAGFGVATLDFGNVTLGQSRTLTVAVSNLYAPQTGYYINPSMMGGLRRNGQFFSSGGLFTYSLTACSMVLAGESCQVSVTFTALSLGTHVFDNIYISDSGYTRAPITFRGVAVP